MSEIARFEMLRSEEAVMGLARHKMDQPMGDYLRDLKTEFRGDPLRRLIADIDLRDAPTNSRGQRMYGQWATKAFERGSLPAIWLCHEVLQPRQIELMVKISRAENERITGPQERLEELGGAYTEYQRATAYHDLYNDWAQQIYGDNFLTGQMFKTGLGEVLRVASLAEEQAKHDDIQALVDQGSKIDWDEGFDELDIHGTPGLEP